jgi:CRP-like cAMP-binding protein
MIEAHLLKLRARDAVSPAEEAAIRAAAGETCEIAADRTFIRAGEELSSSTLLLDGMVCRYKDLRDGQRQITELHLAGDFVDLHSYLLKKLDHGVITLTSCHVAVVPHDNLRRITESHPHLARLLWLTTLVDGATHREWLVAMGRRSALGHFAHLICELFLRLQAVGQTDGYSFMLPATQAELGDTLGISTVHVNRVVQELRTDRLITWQGETVTILDWERLRQVADFDPTYLYLEPEPR